MNKYRVHFCFVFILAMVISITEAGSRKRYRKKKSADKSVNTHMNIEAYVSPTPSTPTPIITTTTPAPRPVVRPTGAPQLQRMMEEPIQYTAPLIEPQRPAAIDPSTLPIDLPPVVEDEEEDNIELNFENADLQNFVKQIEDIFEVTFISDDAVTSQQQQGKKTIKNNKISFKTHKPLSKNETWNIFITFLDIAGFSVIPQAKPKIFRITVIETARKSPLPTFIGVDYKTLPDTDELIRYVYFLENAAVDTIVDIVGPLRSSSSQGLIALKEHKGFILTDKAYNIKMLMAIVKELDKVSIPESMSVLKLRNADAETVKNLYQELLPKEEPSSRFFTKKQPTSFFFPENTRLIADPRTNTLILLGPKNAIKKIENFIIKYIDVELDQAYSPLYTYQLKYADAKTIAEIMTKVTAFGEGKVKEFGGVRGTDQYMRPMAFVAEESTNRLIIRGHYDDYIKAEKIIRQLDAKQPQAAIEVLIASVDLTDTKSLGAQLRSKEPGPNGILGSNIKFQTSGMYGTSTPVTKPDATSGAERLLGNLVNLVLGAVPGTSFLTLGTDAYGVWGAFQALQLITDAEVVSNPFLLATNNAKATVSIGEQRRIVREQVVAPNNTTNASTVNAFDADNALLEVTITPQINSDGMISLAVDITVNEFANQIDPTSATQNTRHITTHAIVANKEVLALGGLIRNNITNVETKVPILGDIPILGWFFKNKRKVTIKQSLLILISTRIIESYKGEEIKNFTSEHIQGYQDTIDYMDSPAVNRDPIHRLFFQDKADRARGSVSGLIFERQARKGEIIAAQEITTESIPKLPIENIEDANSYVQNNLIKTMHSKRRSQLSLAQFLDDKEPQG